MTGKQYISDFRVTVPLTSSIAVFLKLAFYILAFYPLVKTT